MGSSSILQWGAVVLVLCLLTFVIYLTPRELRISAVKFSRLWIGFGVIIFILKLVAGEVTGQLVNGTIEWGVHIAISGATGIIGLIGLVYLPRVTAGRCQDAGLNKWWALLNFAPIIGLGMLLFLMFKSSHSIEPSES